MVKKIILTFMLLLSIAAKAQLPPYVVPNIDWVKYYSETANINNTPSALDGNNNVYLTGKANVSSTLIAMKTLKYDSLGNNLFTASYSDGIHDEGRAIKIDAAGNSYVAGVSYTTTTNIDYLIVKYSPSGSQLWARKYNGAGNDIDEATDIQLDASSNVYVTGRSKNASGNYDIVTLKYSSAGTLLWTNIFNGAASSDDEGVALALSTSGAFVYATGSSKNATPNKDIVVVQISASTGAQNWKKVVIGTGSGDDVPTAITVIGQDAVVCGYCYNTTTGYDYVVTRLKNGSGVLAFQQAYDFSNADNRATAIVRDSTGNFAVTGTAINGTLTEIHTIYCNKTTGALIWVNKETTGLAALTAPPKVATDTIANHFYVSGQIQRASADVLAYQITPTGNTSWKVPFDGTYGDIDCSTDLLVNGVGVVYLSAQCRNVSLKYDYTTIKISQTPVYIPYDPSGEPVANDKLFYKNFGQLIGDNGSSASKVLYYNNLTGPEFFVQKDMVSYSFRKADTLAATIDSLERIDVQFLNSNQLTTLYDFDPAGPKLNYFLPQCGANGITNVVGNKRIFVPNIYPGIDLHYYSNQNGIKYFFVLKPNQSPSAIVLNILGAQSTGLVSGHLKLNGTLGTIDLGTVQAYNAAPTSYSTYTTAPVSCSWNSLGSNRYSVSVPSYTAANPLVIMIAVPNSTASTTTAYNLNYSTYYGSSGNDEFTNIKVDDNTNNRYIAGYTTSGNFPHQNSAFQYAGSSDAVLLKYAGSDSLRYATFYGGSKLDQATGVAIKSNGNVYLVGVTTSTDLTTVSSNRSSADQQALNGQSTSTLISGQDAFILELSYNSLTGLNHKWSRYLGGAGIDWINDIALDKHDNLFMVGYSSSCNYPSKNSLKIYPSNCASGNNYDMVFTKMDSTCKLVYSTYFGGDNTIYDPVSGKYWNRDQAAACDVDTLGQLWITGSVYASSDKAPVNVTTNTTSTSIFNHISDGSGGVLLRVAAPSNTPVIQMYTEVGYSNTQVNDIKVMPDQTAFMCGNTTDSIGGFPLKIKTGSYNRAIPGPYVRRGFFSWMDKDMTNLWTTHFDKQTSTSNYSLNRIAISDDGSLYLSGNLAGDSLTFANTPPTSVYVKNSSVGQNQEGFISYFSSAISGFQLRHTHFLGGTYNDTGYDVDIYKNSALYFVGSTTSYNDYPINSTPANAALIDPTFNGPHGTIDGVVTRFDLTPVTVSVQEIKQDNLLSVNTFPNPVTDQFYINVSQIKNKKNAKVDVYNLAGQLIYSTNFINFNDELLNINCSNWNTGLYIISVVADGSRYAGKVIKE